MFLSLLHFLHIAKYLESNKLNKYLLDIIGRKESKTEGKKEVIKEGKEGWQAWGGQTDEERLSQPINVSFIRKVKTTSKVIRNNICNVLIAVSDVLEVIKKCETSSSSFSSPLSSLEHF